MIKRNLLRIHKWLGLVAGLFIFVMGITGSIIVFDDEIEHYLQRDVIYLPDSNEPVSLDAAYRTIDQKYPDWDVRFTVIPEQADRAIESEIRQSDDRRYLYLHPVTGEILRDLKSDRTFSYWMLKLHYRLHAGFFGEVLLLLAGLAFIGSLITGFWFYRKAIWRVVTFKIRPRFRDLKSTTSELHRLVGVWALVFNFITAVTGSIILAIIVMYSAKATGPAPLPDPPEAHVSVDEVLEQSVQSYPGFTPTYISMPTRPDGKVTIYGHMGSDLPIHYEFSNYIQYDPQSGGETNASFIRNQPLSAHLLSVVYPLHFGDWGGIFIKILYCLAGIAPAVLSVTGFIIWKIRSAKRSRLKLNWLSGAQSESTYRQAV